MSTRTIEALLAIMDDPEYFTSRRIEAAEHLLNFEAPTDTVAHARDYLISVFDNPDETITDRMEALKLSRKCEAARVTPRTIHTSQRETDRTEAWRRYEILQRKFKLIRAIDGHPPPGWDSDLRAPDYSPPPGSEWPPTISVVKDRGR